jgi:hypothetical protein
MRLNILIKIQEATDIREDCMKRSFGISLLGNGRMIKSR